MNEHWVPIGEMAAIFGLTVPKFRAIHDRMGRPCQRKRGTGKTSPVEINTVGWLAAWNVGPSDAAAQHARLKKAQADRAEIEVEKLRGELLTKDEAEQIWKWYVETMQATHQRLCQRCSERVNEAIEYAKEAQEQAADESKASRNRVEVSRRLQTQENGKARPTQKRKVSHA